MCGRIVNHMDASMICQRKAMKEQCETSRKQTKKQRKNQRNMAREVVVASKDERGTWFHIKKVTAVSVCLEHRAIVAIVFITGVCLFELFGVAYDTRHTHTLMKQTHRKYRTWWG